MVYETGKPIIIGIIYEYVLYLHSSLTKYTVAFFLLFLDVLSAEGSTLDCHKTRSVQYRIQLQQNSCTWNYQCTCFLYGAWTYDFYGENRDFFWAPVTLASLVAILGSKKVESCINNRYINGLELYVILRSHSFQRDKVNSLCPASHPLFPLPELSEFPSSQWEGEEEGFPSPSPFLALFNRTI